MADDAVLSAYIDEDVDPRRIRSRNRLLDAAAHLLTTGGIEAVTIEAVTKASKVARTTLYRHFNSSSHLLAATFERLLPQVEPLPPSAESLRDRLAALLTRQSRLFGEAPLHLTTLAWAALGPAATQDSSADRNDMVTLRTRLVEQYRKPFADLLQSEEARDTMPGLDVDLAICQLVGPLVFARLTGLHSMGVSDCARIVDDLLTARQHSEPSASAGDEL